VHRPQLHSRTPLTFFQCFQDNSDTQYASFRDNIPPLLLLLIAHPLVRRVYQSYANRSKVQTKPSGHAVIGAGEAQLEQRMQFDFWFGLVFITVLHGASALKVLAILYINFRIGKDVPRPYVPAITWGFNIFILFANELSVGYPLAPIAKAFAPGSGAAGEQASTLVQWAQAVDDLGGLMPRWEVLFKVTVLRLISFNMDNYWSVDYPASSPIEVSINTLSPRYGMTTRLTGPSTRRSNSTLRPSLIVIVSRFQQNPQLLVCEIISHMYFTRHCTWPVQF
jgi:hypothetical protein